jgi:hypothetical protein
MSGKCVEATLNSVPPRPGARFRYDVIAVVANAGDFPCFISIKRSRFLVANVHIQFSFYHFKWVKVLQSRAADAS